MVINMVYVIDLYKEFIGVDKGMNKKMTESVERSRKEMQDGELYDWDEFKRIVDENGTNSKFSQVK